MSNVESKEVPDTPIPEGTIEGSEEAAVLTAEECEKADAAENKALSRRGKLSGEQRLELYRLFKEGFSRKALNKKFGISYPTTTKIIREMEAEEKKANEALDLLPQ